MKQTSWQQKAFPFGSALASIALAMALLEPFHLEMVEIAVEDEGRGIPVEMHERVFEKFFRVTLDAKVAVGGLGLGLAIARHCGIARRENLDYSGRK